ncbi:NADH-quinone oxidoreductase subunit C [Candidatus Amoebophilus asiaticus]|nr:NADH-quinone oxidoreductase subunit C [Candidatus Amoebophilus asiaticus]
MSNEELKDRITSLIPDAEFNEEGEFLNIIVDSDKLYSLAKYLRETEDTDFDYLFCLTCIDWLEYFYTVYHLTSKRHKHTIVLKAKITDHDNPGVDTVCDIWKTAEFHEREVYDLFGVKFKNHPDLRRIFLEDDWVGHPLRKDYVDKVNIVDL